MLPIGSTALFLALFMPSTASAADGARYLIIAPSSHASALQRLADWKTRKGMLAKVVTTAETGYSYLEIHDYILEATETWDPPPEFVLIGADISVITMPSVSSYPTDTYYGNLDDDMFVEIYPGRLPARSSAEVELMVERTLQYERHPVLDDPEWYGRADLLIYEDYDDDDVVTYFSDARWEAGLMKQAGMEGVNVYSYATTSGIYNQFLADLNAGLAYAGHHGVIGSPCNWPGYNVDPNIITAGPMLPIIVSFTCQTVAYPGYECYGEQWMRAGSVADPRGATAYVGQAASCSYCAQWRSSLRRGFWGYIFEDTDDEDLVTFGKAVEEGRKHYYDEFHNASQYYAATVYGDPELNLWTAPPQQMEVSYPPSMPRGDVDFTVTVTLEGQPRKGVQVCVMSYEGTYAWDKTNSAGQVNFSIDTSADTVLYLTATGRNLNPYETTMALPAIWAPDTGHPEDPADDTAEPDNIHAINPRGDCGCDGAGGSVPVGGLLALFLGGGLALRRRNGSPA